MPFFSRFLFSSLLFFFDARKCDVMDGTAQVLALAHAAIV
jgi:hypothetical protein